MNAEEEHPGSDEDRGEEVEGRELKGRQAEGCRESKSFSENFVKLKRHNRKQQTKEGGMNEGDENAECDRNLTLSTHRFPIHNCIYTQGVSSISD